MRAMSVIIIVLLIASIATGERIFFDNRDLTFQMRYIDDYGYFPEGDALDIRRSPDWHAGGGLPWSLLQDSPHAFITIASRSPSSSGDLIFDQFIASAASIATEGSPSPQGEERDYLVLLPAMISSGDLIGPDTHPFCAGVSERCGPSAGYGYSDGLLRYLGDEGILGFEIEIEGQTHYGYVWLKWPRGVGFRARTYIPIGWGWETAPETPVEVYTPTNACPCEMDGVGVRPTVTDLISFVELWLPQTGGPPTHGWGTGADVESDGVVNMLDLLSFLDCYLAFAPIGTPACQ